MGVKQSIVSLSGLHAFSFRQSPVLVIENFWLPEERQYFRKAMKEAAWTSLGDLATVREDSPNSGNWAKADIALAQGRRFLSRVQLPCVREHVESFPDIVGRHKGFSYYSYAADDCLPTHDDTDQGYLMKGMKAPRCRIAVVSDFLDDWHSDWGRGTDHLRKTNGAHIRKAGSRSQPLYRTASRLPGDAYGSPVPSGLSSRQGSR